MADTEQALQTFKLVFGDEPYFDGGTEGVQSHVERGLLLTALVSLLAGDRPLRVLEVGAWVGFSALTWADAIDRFNPAGGEVVCVDQWQPYFAAVDQASRHRRMDELARTGLAYALFLHNTGCGPKSAPIRHIRGRSAEILPTLPAASFDIVYIDGSHYYAEVKADLVEAKRLVAEGGVLAGDDLELQIGPDIDEATVRQALERDYAADAQQRGYHPGVTLAVAEEFGRVSALAGTWFMQRRAGGFQPVDLAAARMILPRHWPPHVRQVAQEFLRRGPASKAG